MRRIVGFTEAFFSDVCVNLRRGKRSVPKEGLNRSQVGSVVEKVGCEGVTEFVRSHFEGDGGVLEVFIQRIPNGAGG